MSECSSSMRIEVSRVTFCERRESFSRIKMTFEAVCKHNSFKMSEEGSFGEGSRMHK